MMKRLLALLLVLATPAFCGTPIVEQRVSKDEIYIRCVGDRVFSLTRTDIRDFFQLQTGGVATRKQKTIDWVKAAIVLSLGDDFLNASGITFDFDTADFNKAIYLETIGVK